MDLLKDEEFTRKVSVTNVEVARRSADWTKSVEVFYDAMETLAESSPAGMLQG